MLKYMKNSNKPLLSIRNIRIMKPNKTPTGIKLRCPERKCKVFVTQNNILFHINKKGEYKDTVEKIAQKRIH